jgi:hypothetical protein
MSESSSKTTTDLKTIQEWAEKRDASQRGLNQQETKRTVECYELIFPVIRRRYFGRNFVGGMV